MITKQVTMTVSADKATLSENVVLFKGDKGVCIEITLKQLKYQFGATVTHPYEIERDTEAEVHVIKPSKEEFTIQKTTIENNVVHCHIDNTWLDEECEIGTHYLQIHLHHGTSRVTLPVVTFRVADTLDLENVDEGGGSNTSGTSGMTKAQIQRLIDEQVDARLKELQEQVDSKANANHSHDGEYMTTTQTIKTSQLPTSVISKLQDVQRIEFVKVLPSNYEKGVLYFVLK